MKLRLGDYIRLPITIQLFSLLGIWDVKRIFIHFHPDYGGTLDTLTAEGYQTCNPSVFFGVLFVKLGDLIFDYSFYSFITLEDGWYILNLNEIRNRIVRETIGHNSSSKII